MASDALEFRAATDADVESIVRISTGPIADKRSFIVESLTRRTVIAAAVEDRVVGYIIWDRSFFSRPFVWLLGVDPVFRRQGLALRLIAAFEAACYGEGLFTSTNESNRAMQALLARIGFAPSGRLENLDPADPELFYFKGATQANP